MCEKCKNSKCKSDDDCRKYHKNDQNWNKKHDNHEKCNNHDKYDKCEKKWNYECKCKDCCECVICKQGKQGKTGEQGIQGIQGVQGPIGPQGIQGPTGADGAQGIQGPTGAQGIQGPIGPQGIQGPIGPEATQDWGMFSGVFAQDGSCIDVNDFLNLTVSAISSSGDITFGGNPNEILIKNIGNFLVLYSNINMGTNGYELYLNGAAVPTSTHKGNSRELSSNFIVQTTVANSILQVKYIPPYFGLSTSNSGNNYHVTVTEL
jgi:hypothetical protein